MSDRLRTLITLTAALTLAVASLAQAQATASGHWEGTIAAPGREISVIIDLKADGGKWQGTVGIPGEKLKGLPLTNITVAGEGVAFAMPGPGDPSFKGTLSKDGKTLSGDFTQGGGSVPFTLTRTGDAQIDPLPKSTPITSDLQGTWAGALAIKDMTLRLSIEFSTAADGTGTGTLVSLDQGNATIPVAAVIQKGAAVRFFVPSVAGSFEGTLKDGELSGTWTQGGGALPLVFKRAK
jgi:hypothetical protein